MDNVTVGVHVYSCDLLCCYDSKIRKTYGDCLIPLSTNPAGRQCELECYLFAAGRLPQHDRIPQSLNLNIAGYLEAYGAAFVQFKMVV